MDIKILNEEMDSLIVDFYENYYLNEEDVEVEVDEDKLDENSDVLEKLLNVVTDFVTKNAKGSNADYALMFINMIKDSISGEYEGFSSETAKTLLMFVALDAADVLSDVWALAEVALTAGGALLLALAQKGLVKGTKNFVKKLLSKYLIKANPHLRNLKENQGLQDLIKSLKQDIDDYREWKLGSDLASVAEE